MRPIFAVVLAALGACAPQYVETIATSDQDLPVRRAVFAETPAPLDLAFRSSCDSPGDELRQISRSVVQCRILPPPDLAAFLVLQYDGALQAPTLVVQKETDSEADNFVVELSYFAEVVQKSGKARRIYFKQRDLDQLMDRLLAATGGVATNVR
ncbi:hypothetical protein [uncultured Tateyamaria sp.]|uniref:hypothetical protein n=1 Tax=uncultured Tateyamaria sp. TaxID=455651 RepID=UPI00261830A2|nr:hypothetical protein [uncultured Tateyamaria sp.]